MKKPRQNSGRGSARRNLSAGREELLRGLRFDTRTLTIAGLIVVGALTLTPPIQLLMEQRQMIADQQAKVEEAKQSLEDMKTERKRWEDPVYIRSQARDRLYYVMPGEVSYLVMDANGIDQSDTTGTVGAMIAARTNNGEITTALASTKNNWVDSLIETIVRTGVEQPVETAEVDSAKKGN